MKRIISLVLLGLFVCATVSAQRPPVRKKRPVRQIPPAMLPYVRTVTANIRLWEFDKAAALEESMPEHFARGGWRLEFTRPLMNASVAVTYHADHAPVNSAELLFIVNRKGIDWKRARAVLRWKNKPQELYNTVCDMGTSGNWRIFVRADVQTLDMLKTVLRPEGGDPMEEILAESLLHEDLNSTTRIQVPHLFGKYGNKAILPLKRSLGKAIASEQPVEPFFRAFKYINTPEAAMEFRNALDSGYPGLADRVRQVLVEVPYMKDAVPLYIDTLKRHMHTEPCIKAMLELKEEKKLIPVLEMLRRRPGGYLELVSAVYTLRRIRTGKDVIPENELAERILMLTAREGDVPGSSKMISIKSSESSYNARLSEEEKRRIEPLITSLAGAPDKECAVLAALSLVLFSPAETTFSKEYISRVNRYGWRVLTLLPRKEVLANVIKLRDHSLHDKERNVFSGIAVRLY